MDFFYDTMCFACGTQNQQGLNLRFKKTEEGLRTFFIPQPVHQGYPGLMHGGLTTTILDELMARCVNCLGYHGVTARMELRFRQGVPIGEKIKFEARILQRRKSIVDLEGFAYLPNGQVAAEAKARFMIVAEIGEEWE